MSDPSLLRLALTTRAPQTKEELFWFFKEIVQVPCAPCGNTGKVMFPKVGICRTCGGLGKRGFHFGRKAICADHSAPLDILAELWFGTLRHVLIIANREGGKTQMLALLSHLMMHFGRYSIAHMGSVEAQAFRARDYLQALLSLEPWKKSIQGQMSQSQATLTNGAKIEWLTGTLAQASGVHPELSILDECDQADPDVRQRFLKTPSGPRSCFIEASTHYIQMGTISQILREAPNLPVRRFCLHGDTKISTSSGDLAIRDIVGKENLWVNCSHYGKLALRQARDIRKTRENAPVVKVTFGWSSFLRDERFVGSVIATPDHQFLLKDGSWKEAQDLQPKDRLTPFYKRGQQRAKEKRELQVSENHRVISVEPAGTADVYCMDVPGSENFVANGVIVHNCLWESLAQCDYDCEKMPQLDGKLARCALYESIEHTADGRMQVVPLCGGTIARQCDGHIDVIHAQLQWAKSDPWSRRVEYLCEPPDRPVGGRAYWNYHSAQNRLNFNPDIQPNKPLEWTMDFGPGVGARMCSTILQTSPDGTEDWIVDEIVLGTSSTSEVIKEFLRRYGPLGCIAPQHSGGIWIYGDRSGHTRASTTGDTDYDLIIAALRNTPGFRLLVFSGDANPPLIDRLNLVNRLLCDENGRRRLKVAQKCKETARELELMPLGADRKKDKSDKVQRVLGLSHIGDGIEYWAWKKYGRSGMVMGNDNLKIAPVVALGNVRRESSILVSRSGRRSSMDK